MQMEYRGSEGRRGGRGGEGCRRAQIKGRDEGRSVMKHMGKRGEGEGTVLRGVEASTLPGVLLTQRIREEAIMLIN